MSINIQSNQFKSRKFIGFLLVIFILVILAIINIITTITMDLVEFGSLLIAAYGLMVGGNAAERYTNMRTNNNAVINDIKNEDL